MADQPSRDIAHFRLQHASRLAGDCPTVFSVPVPTREEGDIDGVAVCDECGTGVRYLVNPQKEARTPWGWAVYVFTGVAVLGALAGVTAAVIRWEDANVDAPPGTTSDLAVLFGALFNDGGVTCVLFVVMMALAIAFIAQSVRGAGVSKHPDSRAMGHEIIDVRVEKSKPEVAPDDTASTDESDEAAGDRPDAGGE